MEETNFGSYGMRDVYPGGVFKYAVPKEKVILSLGSYQYVKICESMYYHDMNNMILQGYITIDGGFNVKAECCDFPGKSLRESMENPQYKWYFNDVEDKCPRILSQSGILDMIYENGLFETIVEFTYYKEKVGINKERLLIWEIRNY